MPWKEENGILVEYDTNGVATGRTYDPSGEYNSAGTIAASVGGGAVAGSTIGAGLGSVVPGLGTVGGGIVGGITGGISGLIGGTTDGLRANNLLKRGTVEEVEKEYLRWLNTGELPTTETTNYKKGELKNIIHDIKVLAEAQGLDFETYVPDDIMTARLEAIAAHEFNNYYNDIYNYQQEGTAAYDMYNQLADTYTQQAQQANVLANVDYQNQAMQQAATVKQITDQVRAERMARLKSGMSESQIANQDMQMMMANVNTLNQNAAMMNQARLQAQVGIQDAQNQAYLSFLEQANAKGQVGAAMAASDAADPVQIAYKIWAENPTWTYEQALKAAQTGAE